jgi:hypothetical protein
MEVLYQLSYPGAGAHCSVAPGMDPDTRSQAERLTTILTLGAVLTIVIGLVLGLFVTPFGWIAVAVGLSDLAWIAFFRGRAERL